MRSLILLSIALTATAVAAKPAPSAPQPFDPIIFFSGRTEGEGDLKVVMRSSRAVRVHGVGRVRADGSLVLDQKVEQAGKPDETRQWVIRRAGPGRYAGTLSDAAGPISAARQGNAFHLAYRTKSGTAIEQWITMDADGRTAHNRLVARKFGMVVAHLGETIRKVD